MVGCDLPGGKAAMGLAPGGDVTGRTGTGGIMVVGRDAGPGTDG